MAKSSGLGPLPRIHPREERCTKAKLDLITEIWALKEKFDLTDLELLRVVHEALADHNGGFIKFAIREERHGDTDKPGGLA